MLVFSKMSKFFKLTSEKLPVIFVVPSTLEAGVKKSMKSTHWMEMFLILKIISIEKIFYVPFEATDKNRL